jgi:hypothetical protein
MKYIIKFTSKDCPACKLEASTFNQLNKINSFNHTNNRFLIVDMQDSGHRIWIELFKPAASPSILIIDPGDELNAAAFKVEKIFTGVACTDNAWEYLGFDIPWVSKLLPLEKPDHPIINK